MRRNVLTLVGADGAELVAVVHEPAGPPRSVTLLLAGGVLPRMGVNRVLVRMADRLAAAGHRAVRVDPGGLGESGGSLPEEPFFDLLRRVESGAFVDDVRLTAEAVAPAEAGVPLVLFGTCGGGITALRVADQLERVTGVIAGGVPLKRSGARIPPGFARRTERRRALRQLAECAIARAPVAVRESSGRSCGRSARSRVACRTTRTAGSTRRCSLDEGALRTPLPCRSCTARTTSCATRSRSSSWVCTARRAPLVRARADPAVGHQLDDPDEVDAVAERIQRFAEQLPCPPGAGEHASAVLRPAGDPAAS
jgi:pimeloyl-ACP methyl ester carboxylesterase